MRKSNMTKEEFKSEIAKLKNHIGEFDENSHQLLLEICDILKSARNPWPDLEKNMWITQDGDWYELTVYSSSKNKDFFIDYERVIYEPTDINSENKKATTYDAKMFLFELVIALYSTLIKASKGEYLSWLEENLPYKYRCGYLHLSDVSKESAALLRENTTGLSSEEKECFLSYKDKGYILHGMQITFWDMNARLYYKIFACCARECGFDGADTMSDKELFFKYFADEADDSIEEIDENDFRAFTHWYDQRGCGGNVYFSYRERTYLPAGLSLCQDEVGYFVAVYARTPEGNAMAVRFYNALIKENIPTYIKDGYRLASWVEEDFRVYIRSESLMENNKITENKGFWHAITTYENLPNDELKNAVRWYEEKDLEFA